MPLLSRLRALPFFRPVPKARLERIAALLGFFWALLIAAFYLAGVFDEMEDHLLDWEQTVLASHAPGDDFALIAISRVPSDRPWPWPRLDYALVLRGLISDHPQSVVFEMLMHDQDPRFSSFDPSFRELVDRTDAVVFAAAALQSPGKEPVPANIASLRIQGKPGHVAAFGSFLWPVDTFSEASAVGIANFSSDPGQMLRRVPLVFRLRDRIVPSLALTAAALRIGADLQQSELRPGVCILLRNPSGRLLRRIPVDDEGRLQLRFRNPGFDLLRVNYDDFLLYADQVERNVVPAVDLRKFAGRQVWVGATDPSVSDPIRTTVGPKMPVEIGLQAASQIVRNDFVTSVPRPLVACLFLLSGVLLAYVSQRLRPVETVLMVGGIAAAVFLYAVLAFVVGNVHFPLVPFLVLAAGIVFVSRAAAAWELRGDLPHESPPPPPPEPAT